MIDRDPKLVQAEHLLERLRQSQKSIVLQSLSALLIGILIAIWLTAAYVEATFHLAPAYRLTLLLVAVALSIVATIRLTLTLTTDKRLGSSDETRHYWALALGALATERFRDRLLNALQITLPDSTHRDTPSTDLAQEALYRAVADLDVVEPTQALTKAERTNAFKISAVMLLALLVSLGLRPASLSSSLIRIVHPFTDYAPAIPFDIKVSPAGGWAYRSEPVSFVVTVSGESPGTAQFVYRQSGGDEVSTDVSLLKSPTKIDFPGFSSDIAYYIRSNEFKTVQYDLKIISRPQIVELNCQTKPPSYTGLPTALGRENVGDVECLPGSKVSISIVASKRLSSATLLMSNPAGSASEVDSLPLNISAKEGSLDFTVTRPATYTIRLIDQEGHTDKDPVTYRIQTLIDEYPLVRIVYPEGDVSLGDDMHVLLSLEAEDDYGLSRLELDYRNLNGDSTAQSMPINPSISARTLTLDTLWMVGRLDLMPGDVLEYWTVVWDNDRVSGPKRSESSRRLLRLPTFEEIIAGVEQTESEAELGAQKTLEAAKELKEEVAKLVEEMRRDPNTDWERERQLDDAMKNQQELSKQAQDLSKTLDDLVKKLEKNDLLTPETLEKYMQLQKLMQEVASPELKEAMDKLREAMDSQDPEKIRQALEEFDMDREQFMQSIERSLAILQQLKLERKLDELTKRAEELLHAQEEILKDLESGNNDDALKSLDVQKRGLEALKREMKEASEMASEAKESDLAQNLESLSSEFQQMQLPAQIDQTGNETKSGQKNKAMQSGEKSARDLASLSSSLKNLSKDFKEQNKAELAQKIRRLVEEMIYVSQDQERLMVESQELGTQSPRYRDIAGDQQDVKQALSGIAERMLDLSRETFFVTPELGATIGKALQQIDRSLAGFSDRMPRSAYQPQRQALGEINRGAAQLLTILNQLSESNSSSGYEEMMQKLTEMAQQQQGLNQQSNGMPMPGQGSSGQMPGQGQSLSQMAAQQRALQQQMEQAADEAQGIEDMLGDLQGIADAMGDVAKDFENKELTDRTKRLQQQIVSRLLDATRSAREEQYSKKRESKAGQEAMRASPAELKLDQMKDRLRQDLLKALQEGYTPDYRRLIREYYDALGKSEDKK